MKVLIHDASFLNRLQAVVSDVSATKFKGSQLHICILIGIVGAKDSTLLHVAPCVTPANEEENALRLWVAGHACEVLRMLPGGVDILGLAIIAQSALFEANKSFFKTLLTSLHGAISGTPQLGILDHRIILHMDPTSMKMTSRAFDLTRSTDTGNLQDLKLVKNCTNLLEIGCIVSVDSLIYVSEEVLRGDLETQMEHFTQKVKESLQNSEVYLGGKRREHSCLLSDIVPSNGARELKVEFILNQFKSPATEDFQTAVSTSIGARVSIRGALSLRALLPPRATCGNAVAAIQLDALRSLETRCAMHCKDMELIEDEQRDANLRHVLPRRVFISHKEAPSGVSFCDYVFHGEDLNSSQEAIREILGVSLSSYEIMQGEDENPLDEALANTEEAAKVEEFVEEIISQGARQFQSNSRNSLILTAIGACVGLLAVLIAYAILR